MYSRQGGGVILPPLHPQQKKEEEEKEKRISPAGGKMRLRSFQSNCQDKSLGWIFGGLGALFTASADTGHELLLWPPWQQDKNPTERLSTEGYIHPAFFHFYWCSVSDKAQHGDTHPFMRWNRGADGFLLVHIKWQGLAAR